MADNVESTNFDDWNPKEIPSNDNNLEGTKISESIASGSNIIQARTVFEEIEEPTSTLSSSSVSKAGRVEAWNSIDILHSASEEQKRWFLTCWSVILHTALMLTGVIASIVIRDIRYLAISEVGVVALPLRKMFAHYFPRT